MVPEVPPPAQVATSTGQEPPPVKELLEVRVRRLLDDFDQRHQQRMIEMSAYDKAGSAEPGVKQFADPRKVEVELKDEQDREETSQALAKEYAEESRQVQTQEQALQDFIAKRQKTLDDMNQRVVAVNRQDLELAAANLARQPGTEAQVSELRRRLAEADRNARELSSRESQGKQEAASSAEELKKLRALEESLDKESKAYLADAASAHQNQLHLADRLEYYAVNAQAEDVLDQDRKATEGVQHLAASPEVHATLESLGPGAKADAKPGPSKKCSEAPNDMQGCTEKPAPVPKE
jgi:DNA repair exonuclease SbcCD ATPase subunit